MVTLAEALEEIERVGTVVPLVVMEGGGEALADKPSDPVEDEDVLPLREYSAVSLDVTEKLRVPSGGDGDGVPLAQGVAVGLVLWLTVGLLVGEALCVVDEEVQSVLVEVALKVALPLGVPDEESVSVPLLLLLAAPENDTEEGALALALTVVDREEDVETVTERDVDELELREAPLLGSEEGLPPAVPDTDAVLLTLEVGRRVWVPEGDEERDKALVALGMLDALAGAMLPLPVGLELPLACDALAELLAAADAEVLTVKESDGSEDTDAEVVRVPKGEGDSVKSGVLVDVAQVLGEGI